MHLVKVVVSLAFAIGVLAAVAAVPTSGDSVVVERLDISARDVSGPLRPAHPMVQEYHGLRSDCQKSGPFHPARSKLYYIREVLQDALQSFKLDTGRSPGEDSCEHSHEGITACFANVIKRSPEAHREVENAVNVVSEEQTVTAAPTGTTTVFVPPASSASAANDGVEFIPQELILTHTSDGSTVVTTAIVQTTVIATVTTAGDSAWASASTLSDGQSQNSLVTLTNPINPEITTVITAGAATTPCVNNTSIDIHSYINISTFSASGIVLQSTTFSSSIISTLPTSSSLSVDSSLVSRMSSEMAPYGPLASKTLTLDGAKSSTGTFPGKSATASAISSSSKSSEVFFVRSGIIPATMLAGVAAFLVLALFL